ncbi:hypothetical protein AWRIB429_0495 [Oenococcus oeni AWRIB429]|uniref:Uncharacterized protein n=1 Tax=Oenococcus oeni AWRIB429 TaxID=655225 RepID=D3L815_OENOE|nr:hypothetical protein AWRIB429_0495 [Oenococcus oeni AWRIB429]
MSIRSPLFSVITGNYVDNLKWEIQIISHKIAFHGCDFCV